MAGDWLHLFPRLPHQSEANRRTRWLRGAFEQIRVALAARLPEDDCQQIDTSALPVKHTSRVRGPDSWTGPEGLHARFGRDAAHAEWFCGFRLAIKTDLGSRRPARGPGQAHQPRARLRRRGRSFDAADLKARP